MVFGPMQYLEIPELENAYHGQKQNQGSEKVDPDMEASLQAKFCGGSCAHRLEESSL